MSDQDSFELIREERIEELNTMARLYRHIQTGAELLSLENNDENKVFGITFRTPPADSTGLPHIMEHSVLCGSRKYPVKEPFVELMKGSLNTFLNAMTFPDKTCYPVASQNLQDFYNLLDVYMDAVLFPRLSPYTLMQEGWHYELDDPTSPLQYKGVVFNEMKGAYSTPDSVLDEHSMFSLFPENAYHNDSGGNPALIPNLTFEQFQAFHETYYHPSNARIFFYGDDDPAMRLVLMDEYLHLFDPIPLKSQVELQSPFAEPRQVKIPYEISEDQQDPKSYITLNWLLPETGDPELALGLAVLEQILIGTPAAQLRKALIDSGMGEDITGRGLETGSRQMFFSTGLKGVEQEKVAQVEKLILDTLTNLAINGVDPENIAAAMNTIEFRLRENNTGAYPRGLILMLRSLEFWLYDKDPLAPLSFEEPLKAIKARIQSGDPYFEHLIEAYLVNNTHRTSVILTPDPDLGTKREAAERERLDRERQGMDDLMVQQVLENCQTLKERQETADTPEMLSTIPMLDREDLDQEIRRIPIEVLPAQQGKILYHDLFTNGILYLDLGFNLHALPQEWIPYIPLFSRALTETGTTKESFVQLLQRIGRSTGGIRPSTLTSARRVSNDSVTWLFLRGKAMVPQTADLLAILSDVLSQARLEDQDRFRQMALEEKARLESRLANAGHIMVNTRLRARFDEADWASEQMGGISYLFFLRSLIQQIDSDWPAVQNTLMSIRETLLTGPNSITNITVDSGNWQIVKPQINNFLASLPTGTPGLQAWSPADLPDAEGLTIPAQVNFVGKGTNLYQHGYTLNGSAFVITNHLNGTWIWDKIRVQGGAYGGFAVFDNQSGVYTYLSYRDPNLVQTLEMYDATSQYLSTLELSDEELTKAIIGTIGDLDAYQLPDAKGFTSMRYHLLDLTDDERQRLRNEVLATSQEDFRKFASTVDLVKKHGVITVLGENEAVQSAGLFKDIKKVL
jgi:presequence protease